MDVRADDESRPAVVRLPVVLDGDGAARLAADLRALSGRPVSIDASAVERLGAQGLQVLLAARKTWSADGAAMTLDRASEAFEDAMLLFGVPSGGDGPKGWIRDVV